ncbi:MAG: hypothetical protein AB3N11_06955 [Arenibacterium sp.]
MTGGRRADCILREGGSDKIAVGGGGDPLIGGQTEDVLRGNGG